MMWLGWAAFLSISFASATFADSGLATDTAAAIGEAPRCGTTAPIDVGYVVNFNFSENHLWRNRATASRHNEFAEYGPGVCQGRMRVGGMELGAWNSAGEREVRGYDSEPMCRIWLDREGALLQPAFQQPNRV